MVGKTVQSVMKRTGGRSKARVFVRKGDDQSIPRTAFGKDKYVKQQPMKLKQFLDQRVFNKSMSIDTGP